MTSQFPKTHGLQNRIKRTTCRRKIARSVHAAPRLTRSPPAPPILLHAGIMQADDDVGKVAAASTHLVGTGRRRTAMNGTSAPLPVTSLTPSTHAPPLNDSRGHRGVSEGGDQWRRLRGRVAGIEAPDAGAHQGARWVSCCSRATSSTSRVSRLASHVSRSRSFARQ